MTTVSHIRRLRMPVILALCLAMMSLAMPAHAHHVGPVDYANTRFYSDFDDSPRRVVGVPVGDCDEDGNGELTGPYGMPQTGQASPDGTLRMLSNSYVSSFHGQSWLRMCVDIVGLPGVPGGPTCHAHMGVNGTGFVDFYDGYSYRLTDITLTPVVRDPVARHMVYGIKATWQAPDGNTGVVTGNHLFETDYFFTPLGRCFEQEDPAPAEYGNLIFADA